ncbi:protein FAM78A isoform X1 [Cygnus atratus]|nr:protein FAM78A isoform X1 [Cygnus atratus]
MGCIQSISCKSKVFRESISVIEVKASIDPIPTSIDESSSVVLRYRTPHFRASAQVLVPPIPKKETWIVGWIQACSHMEFYNHYGEQGMSSWELPDLLDGKIQAISDSDGVNYPWYGNTTETCTIVGPTKKESKFNISMNDNFYPSVTWAVPVSESNVAKLTSIHRDQSFTTWLVATNTATNEMVTLQTIKWRMRLGIESQKASGARTEESSAHQIGAWPSLAGPDRAPERPRLGEAPISCYCYLHLPHRTLPTRNSPSLLLQSHIIYSGNRFNISPAWGKRAQKICPPTAVSNQQTRIRGPHDLPHAQGRPPSSSHHFQRCSAAKLPSPLSTGRSSR